MASDIHKNRSAHWSRAAPGFALVLALVGTLLAAPDVIGQATTPSIDCARATSVAEQMVCGNGALASLDRKLVDVYGAASKAASAEQRNRLAADQQRWLNERDACGKSQEKDACIKERYLQRIADLQAQFKLVA